ncbi:hypothetical protein TNIN_7741 [Trichonephila inaurata madagascariensis]|uniref:Uncharacterized protein n=1 Tax=Trichonephila inaurata madagascariensis TaxID=2747483 RepID=A0A8X6YRN1_9ARAC|nr:hypothetical protein TNIN_7741 [Trichonephila inaurata madagascariensis]
MSNIPDIPFGAASQSTINFSWRGRRPSIKLWQTSGYGPTCYNLKIVSFCRWRLVTIAEKEGLKISPPVLLRLFLPRTIFGHCIVFEMESLEFYQIYEYQIKSLDTSNYSTWSTDVRFLLQEKNCFEIVTGRESAPENKKENQRELKDLNAHQRLALSILYLNISTEYRSIIENVIDPAEA